MEIIIPACRIYTETGLQQHTNLWNDFWIALKSKGEAGVRETYKQAFDQWHTNTVCITELTIVLNWMIWALHDTNEPLARVFDELWRQCDSWCCENLTGEDLDYYYQTTD